MITARDKRRFFDIDADIEEFEDALSRISGSFSAEEDEKMRLEMAALRGETDLSWLIQD